MADNNPFDAIVAQQPEASDNPFDSVVGNTSAPAAPAVNPFEDAVKEGEARRTRQKFLETLKNSKDIIPERQAKAIEVAKLRGVPVGVAYKHLDELSPNFDAPNFEELSKKTPWTAKLLADPIKGPVTFTDHEPLSAMETAFKELGTPQGYSAEEFRRNAGEAATTSFLSRLQSLGTKTPEESSVATQQNVQEKADALTAAQNATADRLAIEQGAAAGFADFEAQRGNFNVPDPMALPKPYADAKAAEEQRQVEAARKALDVALKNPVTQDAWRNFFDSIVGSAVNTLSGVTRDVGAKGDILNALVPDKLETFLYSRFPQFSILFTPPSLRNEKGQGLLTQGSEAADSLIAKAFPLDPSRQGDFSTMLGSGVGSMGVFATAGYIARSLGISTDVAVGLIGALSQGGASAKDAADANASPFVQLLSNLAGDVSGATEGWVGWDRILSGFPDAQGWVQKLFNIGITGAKEGSQEFSQQLISDAVPVLTYDKARDIFGNAFYSALVGAVTGGGLSSLTTAAVSIAERNAGYLTKIGDAAKKAKIAQYAPQILDEHIAQLKQAGAAPEHVTAPTEAVDTLFQEMDPEALRQFPETARSLEEARATGAEVTIPTEELVRLGKLKGYNNFAADVRIGEDMTLNEAVKLREDVSKFVAEQDPTKGPQAQEDSPVFQNIRDQLMATGQSREVATAQARLFDAVFTNMAERTGVPVADLARRYGVEIGNTAVDGAGQTTLSQPGATLASIEEAAAASGVSLAVSENKGVITLSKIVAAEKGQGAGTKVMEALVQYADATGQRLALSPSADFGGSVPRLKEFYKRFGFADNKGRSRDFSISESMIREPAQPTTLYQSDAPARQHGFPKAMPVGSLFTTDAELKAHPDYQAAKAGDTEAAARLVDDLVTGSALEETAKALGADVVYLPVLAREASGDNKIPVMLAERLAAVAGANVETGILQVNKTYHTGGRPLERLLARPVFDGKVTPGARYVLVDDVAVLGGTLSELANHVIAGGGEVAGAETLVNASRSGLEPASKKHQRTVEERFGDVVRELFHVEPSALTADESTILLGYRTVDALRAAAAKAGDERGQRLRSKGIQPPTGSLAPDASQNEPPSGASSASGTTLNQGGKDIRGSISFGPLRDHFRITLTEKANLSTFLHEGGHFFLEVLQDLVERGEASQQQVADLTTLKKWMGLAGADSKQGPARRIDRDGHEKFARSFEQYLMEGKAPSLALHGIFQKFKAWMIFVYKRLANVRGELNDEIRSVMDRLVASDAAIAEARAMVGWRGNPLSQQQTGFTDAEQKAYEAAWIKANDAQSVDADARIMLEAARELQQTWKDEKTKVTKEVEAELAQSRGWKAWKLLQDGEGLEEFGRTTIKIDPETLPKEWRRDAAGMTAPSDQGGMDFDLVAEMLGFDTGEQMMQSIGGAKLAQKAVGARVRQIMVERHGEMDAAQLAQEAMRAVHNTPTMDVLLTEYRALAAKASLRVGRDAARTVYAAAQDRVAQLQGRKLDPAKWRRAEVKAAEEAGKLAAQGKDMDAAFAKRRQLMAAAMAKASLEAQDRIGAIKDYLATFTTNRRRAALGKAGEAYLDQVDQILEAVQFKDVSLKAIKARQGLDEFVKEQEAQGEPVFISSETRNLLGRRNYTEMTLQELEGIHDAVKNLWTVAKEINTVRKGAEKIALENALADIEKEADETLTVKKQRDHLNPGRIDRMMAGISRYHAGNLKIEFILDWLGKTAHSLIYQPITNASFESWKLHRDLTAPFMEKLRTMPKEQKRRWNTKRQFLNYPMPLKGANIWTIALNMGNAGNKEKMLAGYGWTESQVMAELNTFMTKEDWDLAQETWDTINSMWPKMEAVVKKATGLSPPKVEATEVVTPYGTYRGGYFPVVYDRQIDARMDDKLDSSISPEEMFSKRFTAFAIDNGFTKGRTKVTGKLLFSPDIIAEHLGEVIHYATHYEAVKQADKIIRSPVFKALVKSRLGDAVYAEMKQWLKDVATNTTRSDRQTKAGDWALRWARNSAQLTSLGLNIKSALKQPLGIVTTLDAIGAKHLAIGIQKAWLSPYAVRNWKDGFAKSKELLPLIKNYDRDLATISRAYADSIGNRAHQGLYQLAFMPISVMQSVANMAAWHGAYSQATEQGMSEQDAIDFADKIVRTTQGSGALKDLSGIQRGSEANKFFTMFYSYFSVLYNRLADVQVRERGVKNLHRKVGRYAVLLIMGELLNSLFDEGWDKMFPPDKKKDDGQPFATRLALNMVDSAINTMPVVRDAYSAVTAIVGGGQVRTPPALGGVAKAIAGGKAIADLVQGKDMTRAKARNIMALTSILTNTPVYGAYRTIDDLAAFFGRPLVDE